MRERPDVSFTGEGGGEGRKTYIPRAYEGKKKRPLH